MMSVQQSNALSAADRLKQLQAKIAASMGNVPNLSTNSTFRMPAIVPSNLTQQKPKPAPILLNSEGMTVDAEGNEIKLLKRVPTLKANIKGQRKDQIIKPIITKSNYQENDQQSTAFYDQRVELKATTRAKKGFRFNEPGKYEVMADKIRKQAQLNQLQIGISENSKKHGISLAARLQMLNSIEPKLEEKINEIPEIEWWDECILKGSSYDEYLKNKDKPNEELFENITHLIEHPMQMRPPTEPLKPTLLPVFLTKKERKKLRRQNRREAMRDKQEKIRLGLLPPEEPKVKMSNMMRVLGSQAVQDPTKIEEAVKEQVAKRKRDHEDTNETRKLTDEQRREKRIRKIKEDTSLGVHVSVYRILNLTNHSKKYKVETNAKQLMMTGIAVLYKNINIVVVEGGPKQQKKYRRLMMNRINWSEDLVPKEFCDDKEDVENKCILVWEGQVKQRAFNDFKVKVSPNESFARELFKNQKVGHYFDLAFSSSILEQDS